VPVLSDQESRHELPALPIVVDQRAGRPNGTWFGRLWRQTEGLLGSILDLLCLDLAVPEPVRARQLPIPRSHAAAPAWVSRRP